MTDTESCGSTASHDVVPPRVRDELAKHDLTVDDGGLVRFGTGSRGNPRQWTLGRKIYDTAVIVLIEFFMHTSTATYAQAQFHVARVPIIAAFTTSYLLGQAFGGLLLAPISETFGRKPSYVVSTFFYTICCIVIGASNSLACVIIFRILSGIFSSMGNTVAMGSLADVWDEHARIWAICARVVGAVVSTGVGPVVGTYVGTSSLGWQWVYYIAAICSAALTIGTLGLKESRTSRSVKSKLASVIKKSTSECTPGTYPELQAEGHQPGLTIRTFLSTHLARPVRLLLTEPIITAVTIMEAVSFGALYLIPEALDVVYGSGFGFTARHSSLVALTLCNGPVLSLFTRLIDQHISTAQKRSNALLEPEAKLIGFYIAAPVYAIALF